MNFARIIKNTEKLLADNSPVILSGVAVAGTVATVLFSHKAALKAKELVDAEEERIQLEVVNPVLPLPVKAKVKLVWTAYLPVAASAATTIACIVCAHRITARRAAAMAAAYSLGEKRFREYQDKIVEKLTPAKEEKARAEIAQEQVNANPPVQNQIIVTGNGEVLMHDAPCDRYFRSTVDKVNATVNDINHMVNEVGCATLQDFYVALGLSPTPYSEELGWRDTLLDVRWSAVMVDGREACMSMNYTFEPVRAVRKGCDQDPPF